MTTLTEVLPDYGAAAAELLGGSAALGVCVTTRAELEALADKGRVGVGSGRALSRVFDEDLVFGLLSVSDAPANHRQYPGETESLRVTRLTRTDARNLVAAAIVLAMAIDALGSVELVKTWLVETITALGHQRPADLLKSGRFQEVEDNLGRFIYGVYA